MNRRGCLKMFGIGVMLPVLPIAASAVPAKPKLYPHQEEFLKSLNKWAPKYNFKNVTRDELPDANSKDPVRQVRQQVEQARREGYHGLRLILQKYDLKPPPIVMCAMASIVRHVRDDVYEVVKDRNRSERVLIRLSVQT